MKTELTDDYNSFNGNSELEGIDFGVLGININTLIKDTSSEKEKTVVVKPRSKAKCNNCNYFFEIRTFLSDCPKCSSYNTVIISGKELRVRTYLYE